MKPLFRLLLLALIAAVAGACGNSAKKPDFNQYVSGFSSTGVSVTSPIRVELANEVAGVELNVPIDKKLFKVKPSVSGHAVLTDPRTLVFQPDALLQPGTTYEVQLALDALIPNLPKELRTFTFTVSTIAPHLSYTVQPLKMYGSSDAPLYKFDVEVRTSDYVSDAQSEALVRVSDGAAKDISTSWQHSSNNRLHVLTVSDIKSGAASRMLDVAVNGKSIGQKMEEAQQVKVPGVNDFELLSTRVMRSGDEHYVVCSFSSAIAPEQSLNGLITLSGCRDLRFKIDLNLVTIYPQARMGGAGTLTVHEGIRNVKGGSLLKTYEEKLTFEVLKPRVRFIGKGNIMPLSGDLHVRFEAVSLRAVNVQVVKLYEANMLQFLQVNKLDGSREMARAGRPVASQTITLEADADNAFQQWRSYAIDLSTLITPEPGAVYRVQLSFNREQSTYECTGSSDDDDSYYSEPQPQTLEQAEAAYDNASSNSYYYGDGDGDDEDYYGSSYYANPCTKRYYYRNGTVSRNFFASDIGLVAKRGEGNRVWVTATDLVSAQPKKGITVEAYNYQQQRIGSATTDGDGAALLTVKGKPYVLVAKQDAQRGYLRVDDASALNLSSFDIGGAIVQRGLKGFIYGERGVWRPGDTLFIAFVLEDREHVLPDNHPVSLELYNPQGQIACRQTQSGNPHHFYLFAVKTDDDAPTGSWEARVKVGGSTFSKSLKVETVKPNRLKVDFALADGNMLRSENIAGTLTSRWLHGAVAKSLDAKISMRVSAEKTVFKGYEKYTFDSPLRTIDGEETEIFSGKLNENGVAEVRTTYSVADNAPGTLKLSFLARVFEEGGDYSVGATSATMRPYGTYVGLQEPKGAGDDNMLETDREQTYSVVTLDGSGRAVAVSGLQVAIYKVSWSWWWSSQSNGSANFAQSNYGTRVKTLSVNTDAQGKGSFTFKAAYSDWGRYLVTVSDPKSRNQCGLVSYIDWPSWGGRPRQGAVSGATMLSITADKAKYKVGERATLSIPSSIGSRALVSIENGSRVLRQFWVDGADKQTAVTFDITREMLPNVYAYITLVQPHAQTLNDLPTRLYGVVPIFAEDDNTILHPVLKMPDVLEPATPFTIKVSEQNNRKMTYTIAIVDEGLLDLTGFKTPDPWSTFFAREALGVRTWDMFDYVLGAFGGRIEQLFAVGGDEEAMRKQRAKVNRFKPVVRVLGPFTLNGGTDKHTVVLPPYVGSVRTMLVAGNGEAYGHTEKTTPVRKSLMVMATLPRVLGPGEDVALPVNVFAMDDKIKNVSLEVKANDIFSIAETRADIAFDKPDDRIATFNLHVKERIGRGTVTVVATSGSERAEYSIDIEVRNANPKVYRVQAGIIEPGKSWTANGDLPGMEGTNSATLELSTLPPLNLTQRLGSLLGYPHGCIEQTTSKAFPQLYLQSLTSLSADEQAQAEANVKAALERLKLFLTPEGGFAYWPGDRFANLWGSSYAGHFIVEAENHGYALPYGMKSSWLKFQKNEANAWQKNVSRLTYYTYEQNDFDQAYRLYTLALAKAEEMGAMNRLKERTDLSLQARWMLAAAYIAVGQKSVAEALVNNVSTDVPPYRSSFSQSFGSADRDKAMIVEVLCALGRRTDAFPLVQQISAALAADRWLSTQTTAYCLMAMANFAGGERDSKISATYTDGGAQSVSVKRPLWTAPVKHIGAGTPVEVSNTGSGTLYARLIAQGIPAVGTEAAAAHGMQLEVSYGTPDGTTPVDIKNLTQGTDFMVIVLVKNTGVQGDYKNLTLTQIFPSGWEILNTRMLETIGVKETPFDYRDIRDDRVYTYFSLKAGATAGFAIRLNAAYRGRFYLPAISCEAMYDAGIAANTEGMWVEVK